MKNMWVDGVVHLSQEDDEKINPVGKSLTLLGGINANESSCPRWELRALGIPSPR